MVLIKVSDLYYFTVLVLIWLGKSLGWPWLRSQLIAGIGWFAYRFSSDKRLKATEHLEELYGTQLNRVERDRIVLSSFRSFWCDSFAVLPCPQELTQLDDTVIEGEKILASALDRGKGAILIESNAFGERVTAKQILDRQGFPVHQVHAENHMNGLRNESVHASWLREAVLKNTFERWEKEFVEEIVYLPEDDSLLFTRTLQQRLSQNCIVCSAGDGQEGYKLISVSFLNRSRLFATGMFSLAALSGTPVLPLFCFRDRERGIRLVIGPELNPIKRQVDVSVTAYAQLLEGYIRRYPDQYRNWQQ
ncbi:MAG: lysophospholipid acyltransferase family protein [bacterium]